jgi:hypothetical protein
LYYNLFIGTGRTIWWDWYLSSTIGLNHVISQDDIVQSERVKHIAYQSSILMWNRGKRSLCSGRKLALKLEEIPFFNYMAGISHCNWMARRGGQADNPRYSYKAFSTTCGPSEKEEDTSSNNK